MSTSEQIIDSGLDLAAELDRVTSATDSIRELADRERQLDDLRNGAVQELLASAVRLYAECLERDPVLPAFPRGDGAPSATEALMAVTAILSAVQIEPFELGLWATWGFGGADRRGEEAR